MESLCGCSCINDEMSCSTTAKLAKLSCPINDLADQDLAAIFQRLPPYERLIVSEVCRRWRDISRKSWLDVKTLNLGPIPCKHVAAVIRHCANLQHVFAVRRWLDLNTLAGLSRISSVSRARFYECHFEVGKSSSEAFSAIFSDRLRVTAWSELVLHDATFVMHIKDTLHDHAEHHEAEDYQPEPEGDGNARGYDDFERDLHFSADALPTSLTRLQLSGLRCSDDLTLNQFSFLRGLERLENLECLILHNTPDPFGLSTGYDPEQLIGKALDESEVFGQICRLKNLKVKELCLGPVEPFFEDRGLSRSLADLPPKLEVLFLNDVVGGDNADDLVQFVGRSSDLRILVLSGVEDTGQSWGVHGLTSAVSLGCAFRARERVEADVRLPPLHVFLGKRASANIGFANKPGAPNSAIVHPIDAPMPEFLEREDIAPLFEGVWVAEKIKELAKTGGKLWRYASDYNRQL